MAAIPAAGRFSAASAPPLRQRSPEWRWARCPRIPHAGQPPPYAPSTRRCCAGPRPPPPSRRGWRDAFNQGANHDESRRQAQAHSQGWRSPRCRRRVWRRHRAYRAVPESRTYRVAPPPSHAGADRYRGALADEIRGRAAGSPGDRAECAGERRAVLRRDHAALPEKAPSRPAANHPLGLQRPVPAPPSRRAGAVPSRSTGRTTSPAGISSRSTRHPRRGAVQTERPHRRRTHLHEEQPDSDGYPEAWFTNGFQQTGPFFENKVYHYPNEQQATTLWYHDHALGITRLNVYAGLGGGLYLLRDDHEDSLDLPQRGPRNPADDPGPRLQRGRLAALPVEDTAAIPIRECLRSGFPSSSATPCWSTARCGRSSRSSRESTGFRILNASNARFYHLTLKEAVRTNQATGPTRAGVPADRQRRRVAAGAGRRTRISAPAERYDVVIDFSGVAGQNFVLTNDAKAPFPDGDDVVPDKVMLFKVSGRLSSRTTARCRGHSGRAVLSPRGRRRHPRPRPQRAGVAPPSRTRSSGRSTRGGTAGDRDPRAGSVEIWRIINTTGDAHPIHIHLVQFQILDRQAVRSTRSPRQIVFTGLACSRRTTSGRPSRTRSSYPGR